MIWIRFEIEGQFPDIFMLNFSYNFSNQLRENLRAIETLRIKILLTPLTPKNLQEALWKTMINRIYWGFVVGKKKVAKKEIVTMLANYNPASFSSARLAKKFKKTGEEIVGHKKALDYIYQEWLASSQPVTPGFVLELYELSSGGSLRTSNSELKRMLDYMQSTEESPIIQAAIAYIQILHDQPFSEDNGRFAGLLALLFLYKGGYDVRGLILIDEYYSRNQTDFEEMLKHTFATENVTLWLEFFTQALATQLTRALNEISATSSEPEQPGSFFALTDRQKAILASLDNPQASVTNKKIQKEFKISQITASRDLARLALLGLIFSHGKGRSIFYTKA